MQALRGDLDEKHPGVSPLSIITQPAAWGGSVNEFMDKMEGVAQDLANTRPFMPPHHQCVHGRTLFRKLKELRYSHKKRGLELADFRGKGK